MQKDYKMFPPSVNWDNIDWSTRRPQMDFPVQVWTFATPASVLGVGASCAILCMYKLS